MKLQNEQVGNYYGVPVAIIENSAVYKSSSALSADEVAVFRVSSEVEKRLRRRLLTADFRIVAALIPHSAPTKTENR